MNSEEIIKYYELAKEFNKKANELIDWVDDNFTDDFIYKVVGFEDGQNQVYDDAVALIGEANKSLKGAL